MAERRDTNTLAKFIVDQAIGEKPIKKKLPAHSQRGTARAKSLTPERRRAIARKAADARWEESR